MVMLKLLPEQVSQHWDLVRHALASVQIAGESLTEDTLIDLAAKLISGQIQCWAVHDQENGGLRLGGFVFTSIITDALVNKKNLLLLGLYVINHVNDIKVWKEGLFKLRKFARANDCQNIVFYTDVPDLVAMAERFGSRLIHYGVIET